MNNRKRKKLSSRLVLAASLGATTEVTALLRAGAPAGAANADGTTPLYAAAVHGATDIVVRLLDAGAPVDAESGNDRSEGTPLCGAACWGHTDTVRVLLERGADPNLREDHGSGNSPLALARYGPHPETEAVLIAAGATAT